MTPTHTNSRSLLDNADIYSTQDLVRFKQALYKSGGLAIEGDSDEYRRELYSAVSEPAEAFTTRFTAAKLSYEEWTDTEHAAASGDEEQVRLARFKAADAAEQLTALTTFRKKLSKFCGVYTFLTQIDDYGEPDLEVFYSFAKLLGHRIAGTSLDDVDVSGLVLSDYRISQQDMPEDVSDQILTPVGSGAVVTVPKRDTMARIVERLNQSWGDDGDPVVKARAVNAVSDIVATDNVVSTQITNTSNTKESVLADGRLRNIIIKALLTMMTNELSDLAEQVLDDSQAIEPLTEQVYDLIAAGKRYDTTELTAYLANQNQTNS